MPSRRILVLDDERSLCDYLAILLRREGYAVEIATGVDEAVDRLSQVRCDLVLSDLMIGERSGLEIVQALRTQNLPVVLMTAYGTVEKAVEALRLGARDFILKPFQNETVLKAIRGALENVAPAASTPSQPREAPPPRGGDRLEHDLAGCSPRTQALRQLIRRVAPTESTVLITGESGTGKEVVARSLHRLGPRASRPFLPIHCAALSENLLESELFGHVKGAFTGAVQDSVGLFVAAKGGTVFLDEIGEIPPSTQVKLLRVLQEREVTPVGGTQSTPIDVRIVAATNADLEEMIRKGAFREDLFYRLNVIRVTTPPLRQRREDLPELAQALAIRIARRLGGDPVRLTPPALERLSRYDWPGNIRELENVLERSLVLCDRGEIDADDLRMPPVDAFEAIFARPPAPPLEEIQRAYIYWILVQNQWSVPHSAAVLGLDPARLQRMIDHYGFQEPTAPTS